jgi:hypothetical protein
MDKRGQFYIILAIILSLAFMSVVIPQNKFQESVILEDFDDVSANYIREAPQVANFGIYNDLNVATQLNVYSRDFLYFARIRNPTLELIYIYNNGTNITVTSFANETSTINTTEGASIDILGSEQNTTNKISLNVAGKEFVQQVPLQIKNFGDEFYTGNLPPSKGVVLNIGGLIHNFNTDSSGPGLDVFIRSTSGSIINVQNYGGTGRFPVKI